MVRPGQRRWSRPGRAPCRRRTWRTPRPPRRCSTPCSPDRIVHLAGQSQRAPLLGGPGGHAARERAWVCSTSWRPCAGAACPRASWWWAAPRSTGRRTRASCPSRRTRRCGPLSPYAVSKVAQGFLALQYALSHGLPVIRTRTFHHTGPGRGESFAESSLRPPDRGDRGGPPAPVLAVGNLDAVRDFTDVRDVVRAYWALLERGRRRARSTTSAAGRGVSHRRRAASLLASAAGVAVEVRVDPDAPAPVRRAGAGGRSRASSRRPPAGSRRSRCGARWRDLLEHWRDRPRSRGRRAAPGPPVEGPPHRGHRLPRARTWPGPSHAAGHELRVLARERSDLAGLPAGVEIVRGDVTDAASVRRAAEGCQAVVHMAALVKMWVPDRARFDAVNVDGLRNALQAAAEAGRAARLHVVVHRRGPRGAGARRRVAPCIRATASATTTSGPRRAADVLAREAAAAGQDVVLLYPGVVYGPGDLTDGNLVVKMVADHLGGPPGRDRGPGDRLWSYAFVEDVAQGHVAALERGRRRRALLPGRRQRGHGRASSRRWPRCRARLRRAATSPTPRRPSWAACSTLGGADRAAAQSSPTRWWASSGSTGPTPARRRSGSWGYTSTPLREGCGGPWSGCGPAPDGRRAAAEAGAHRGGRLRVPAAVPHLAAGRASWPSPPFSFNALLLPRIGGRADVAGRRSTARATRSASSCTRFRCWRWSWCSGTTSGWRRRSGGSWPAGDGMASIVGQAVGGPRLPWNRAQGLGRLPGLRRLRDARPPRSSWPGRCACRWGRGPAPGSSPSRCPWRSSARWWSRCAPRSTTTSRCPLAGACLVPLLVQADLTVFFGDPDLPRRRRPRPGHQRGPSRRWPGRRAPSTVGGAALRGRHRDADHRRPAACPAWR